MQPTIDPHYKHTTIIYPKYTNNGVSSYDLLNSSDLDNHFSSTSKNNNPTNSSIINPP